MKKQCFLNEVYRPIFEKDKVIQAHQRSALQLMTVLNRNGDHINNFKSNSKTHLTLDDKKYIPLYVEHIHFLVKKPDG